MYTRAAFYATEPSNAAAYAPVEACGAHEWSYIAHGWRAGSAACSPESDASALTAAVSAAAKPAAAREIAALTAAISAAAKPAAAKIAAVSAAAVSAVALTPT